MKHSILTFATILLAAAGTALYSQHPPTLMTDTSEDFYSIEEKTKHYYDVVGVETEEAAEGEGESGEPVWENEATPFKRWQWFWENRLSVEDSVAASFRGASEALMEYVQNRDDYCQDSEAFESDWSHVGPKEMGSQKMGRIDGVWVNPDNHRHMLVGSNTGGLWESSWNANLQRFEWTCITDDSGIPAMGINEIRVDRSKSPWHIYLASGFNSVSTFGGYGLGVIYSTDGGNSWQVDTNFRNTLASAGAPYPWVGDIALLTDSDELIATSRNKVLKRYSNGQWEVKYTFVNYDENGDPLKTKVNFDDIAIAPGSGDTIYIGGRDKNGRAGGVELLASYDGGENWEVLPIDKGENLIIHGDFYDYELGLSWHNMNQGGQAPEWEIVHTDSGSYDNYMAGTKPIKNTVSQFLHTFQLSNDNKSLIRGNEYVINYYHQVPEYCSLQLVLGEWSFDNQEVIYDTVYQLIQNDTGRSNFALSVPEDRYYNIVGFRATYDGPASSSPHYVLVDSFEIISNSFETLEVEAPTEDEVFVLGHNTGGEGFLVELDRSGASPQWTTLNNHAPSRYYYKDFLVNPLNTDVMYKGVLGGIEHTSDKGQTFSKVDDNDQYLHVDMRGMKLVGPSSSGNSDTIIIGNDGGVSFTLNSLADIENRNGYGLGVTQFYGFANNEKIATNIIGGTQDNGTLRQFTGNDWKHVQGGDGYNTAIGYEHDSIVFAQKGPGFGEAEINRNKNYGLGSWDSVQPYNAKFVLGESPNVRAFDFHEQYRTKMHAGIYRLWSSQDYGDNWGIVKLEQSQPVKAFEVAPYDSSFKYLAYSGTADTGIKFYVKRPFVNWQNKTSGLPIKWWPIMDVTCDPDDPDRVWVALGGIYYGHEVPASPEEVKHRVYYSPDGGDTWQDVSDGLPKFPMTQIVYQENSNDLIYVGTDVGVYVWNKDESRWECFSNNLPPALVTEMEINYSSGKLRVATFGRGIWETPLPNPEENAIHITEDITWQEHRNFGNDVVVEEDVKLTMKGGKDYNFAPGTKIEVKRGATLEISNNAKLLNRANNTWEGIQAWGGPNVGDPSSIKINNGAVIANAHYGIRNCRIEDWGPYLEYSGGTVDIDGATFKDCWKSLEFWKYEEGGVEWIRNSEFLLTENYFNVWGNKEFSTFVSIWDVDGLPYFYNNQFINQAYQEFEHHERGKGIYVEDANILVEGDCGSRDPNTGDCLSYDGNVFKNLFTAIEVVGNGGSIYENAHVKTGNKFINNIWGIRLANTRYDRITSNYFEVPAKPSELSNTYYTTGVVLEHAKGFEVFNNEFKGTSESPANDWSIGVRVSNSGKMGGRIDYNEMDQTKYAIQAEMFNPALHIGCNTFKSNDIALSINPQSRFPFPFPLPPWLNFFADQKASCEGMWNEFQISCSGAPSHINSTVYFNYYENNNNPAPANSNCANISGGGSVIQNCNTTHDCMYNYSWYGILPTHGQAADLRDDIDDDPPYPEIQYLRNELMRSYVSLDTNKSLIYDLLVEMDHKDATRTLVMTARDQGDVAYADSIMDTMSLDTRGDTLFSNIQAVAANALESDEEGEGTLKDMDSTDVQSLYNYSQDTLREAAYARSIHQIATDTAIKKKEEVWTSDKRGPRMPEEKITSDAKLGDNIPNPFEQRTDIPYNIEEDKEVILIVTNYMGQTMKSIRLDPDKRKLTLNTKNWPAGLYYYSLRVGDQVMETKSMTIVK